MVGKHSVAGVPPSFYKLPKSVPDPFVLLGPYVPIFKLGSWTADFFIDLSFPKEIAASLDPAKLFWKTQAASFACPAPQIWQI